MSQWLLLGGAILAEVVATAALKSSDGFSKLWPSIVVVMGYGIAFFLLSMTLRKIPVGIAYAIWSGVGLVLITVASRLFFDQRLDSAALVGMSLIVSGVAIISLFSRSITH